MSKEFNMTEAQALMDKMSMEDPAALIRAIVGEPPKSNGGAAFPQSESVGDVSVTHGGMSLRDYFAASAISNLAHRVGGAHGLSTAEEAASVAYALADAMLAERAK